MITIRKVNIADTIVREQLHVLHTEVFSNDQWAGGAPRWTTGDWWIAFADGKPAAFAGLRPSSRWLNTGYLCSAGVLLPYRGRGLQRRLINKRVAQARAYGWNCCITETVRSNWASMRSLISCGFKPFQPEVSWNEMAEPVYWKLDLEKALA